MEGWWWKKGEFGVRLRAETKGFVVNDWHCLRPEVSSTVHPAAQRR